MGIFYSIEWDTELFFKYTKNTTDLAPCWKLKHKKSSPPPKYSRNEQVHISEKLYMGSRFSFIFSKIERILRYR